MSDPLDRPPADHGADRYGYVELIGAPDGVEPPAHLVDSLACPDCLSNLFLTYVGPGIGRRTGLAVHVWQPRIAHDDGCPIYARIEREASG